MTDYGNDVNRTWLTFIYLLLCAWPQAQHITSFNILWALLQRRMKVRKFKWLVQDLMTVKRQIGTQVFVIPEVLVLTATLLPIASQK